METEFTTVCLRLPVYMEKEAASKAEAAGIMDRIYNERKEWWPYGWTPDCHESVYVVKEASTGKACGVVGWQEFNEGRRRIGSYSIGILPEYRGNGFAKEAVAKVVREKSVGVDEVRAYVVNGNEPSTRLAESLGIRIERKF